MKTNFFSQTNKQTGETVLEADFASRPMEMAQCKGQSDGDARCTSAIHLIAQRVTFTANYLRAYSAVDCVIKTAGHAENNFTFLNNRPIETLK